MFGRRRNDNRSHIPYFPVEELNDAQLTTEIFAIENASDVLPRKRALREERIARHIAEIGLDKTEELLGIVQEQEVTRG